MQRGLKDVIVFIFNDKITRVSMQRGLKGRKMDDIATKLSKK